jgi:hypothetical protein
MITTTVKMKERNDTFTDMSAQMLTDVLHEETKCEDVLVALLQVSRRL